MDNKLKSTFMFTLTTIVQTSKNDRKQVKAVVAGVIKV